jgi:2-polyprenyl-6-methoxyphenol hydroxylase-like FAD-dependent oxidoreductase
MRAAPRTDIDVAIVGAGPVGLVLAALLDRHGLVSRVFERRDGLHRNPQAHVINARTMEVLRELGIERNVQSQAAPPLLMQWITWCESIAGRELGRIALQGDPAVLPGKLAASPTSIANFAQNRLEPLLLDLVAASSRSEVRFSSEVTSVESRDGHVALRVRDGAGASKVRAAWAVACDGASSSVRRSLGIEMDGPSSIQKFVSVYFEANLERYVAGRTGPLFWICGARTRGVVIGFDLVRTWALMVPYSEPATAADFSPAVVERLVRDAIGDEAADFRVTSVGNWNMSAQLAGRYRDGRVFLAGDAAHRFPPSGGFGMNTGIQDAHNLAWKLAAVIGGNAGEALLDTYETERRPVAATNSDQSLRNAMRMFEVDAALGFSTLAPVDPTADMSGKSPLVDYGLDGDSAEAAGKRRSVHDVIQSQAEHFDFGGLDLGFRYETGALVDDGSDAAPVDVRSYTPSARPGSRLPHAWLTRRGVRVSSHDAATPGRFTLVVGGKDPAWIEAAREMVRARRIELDVAVITGGTPGPGEYMDATGEWARVSGIGRTGALLVRPDGHVAWRRCHPAAVSLDEARALLAEALDAVLPSAARDGQINRGARR